MRLWRTRYCGYDFFRPDRLRIGEICNLSYETLRCVIFRNGVGVRFCGARIPLAIRKILFRVVNSSRSIRLDRQRAGTRRPGTKAIVDPVFDPFRSARRIFRHGCLICAAVCLASRGAANGTDLTLHLQACAEDIRVVYGDMGSVSLHVIGPVGDNCEVVVGAEVEAPQGAPRTLCRIPKAMGVPRPSTSCPARRS